jgi:hypothetical protein
MEPDAGTPNAATAGKNNVRGIFIGPDGLRAGWRLTIFIALYIGLNFCAFSALRAWRTHEGLPSNPTLTVLNPQWEFLFDGIQFALLLLATWIMSRMEKRRMGQYGLPLRSGAMGDFGMGCVWGFGALTVLLGIFRAAGDFHITGMALHGGQVFTYLLLWTAAFILVGLTEEFTFRGYAQFTLGQGIGFWPAAILFSLLFAFAHRTNSGEQFWGLAQVVVVALLFCFTLWKTGALWFAVGYHAAWDWGQTFFYGTHDSGLGSVGHLLNSSASGPQWFSGGSVGPEGSVLNVPLVLMVALLFHFAYRKRPSQ